MGLFDYLGLDDRSGIHWI